MHQSVKAVWERFSQPLEGRVHGMYVDVKNLVTTGVGNLIDPVEAALALPWKHENTGARATADEIKAAWNELKNHPGLALKPGGPLVPLPKLHYRYALALNDLRLTDEDIDELVAKKLASNAAHLASKHFHDFESWPADAQLGVLSMAWAVGPDFPVKFPNFSRFANAQDWIAAKACCKIRDTNNPGVVPRNRHNERCFLNAATVHDRGLDPSVLYWPNEAPLEGTAPIASDTPIAPPLSDEDKARIAAQQFDVLDLDGNGFPDREAPTKSDPPTTA